MLIRKYEPTRPYRYIWYGRMSDPGQNARSPEQQLETVETTLARLNYPWQLVGTYRDDGISGRYLKKRPGFQALLRAIEIGLVQVDAIAVDTAERFCRAEEMPEIRRRLFTDYGVLIVTADSNFADPTGPTGKALGMVEQIRSTEDGRIKAHNVNRGKRDAARLKRWPGGPPPLGFGLKRVMDETVRPRGFYSILDPIADYLAAVVSAFVQADHTGWGDLRLAQWWNANPAIPAALKPMHLDTMGYVLTNKIYVGTLEWGKNMTGVVNDTRVVEPNPDGPQVVVPDFRPPSVPRDLFDRVQADRRSRAERRNPRPGTPPSDSAKLIAPQAPGLVLKYPLAGLVRCGCCHAAMRAATSGRKSKGGQKYTYYRCPVALTGACPNDRTVREDRLRASVFSRLRAALFPIDGCSDAAPPWFPGFVALVQADAGRLRAAGPDRAAARAAEKARLEDSVTGWSVTLGNPRLPTTIREDIELQYDQAKRRLAEIAQEGQSEAALDQHLNRVLDHNGVVKCLRDLAEVLSGTNPTRLNLELSKHIDRIVVHPDGRVELVGTWLGVFDGAVSIVSRSDTGSPTPAIATANGIGHTVAPRVRGRLRLPSLSSSGHGADPDTVLDPDRFAGLAPEFFWVEPLDLAGPQSWAEEYAAEVASLRSQNMTHAELAKHFGKSVPTIRAALAHAATKHPGTGTVPRKVPRRKWQDEHFVEVAERRKAGLTLKELCAHFGKSEPLIRAALRLAAEAAKENDGSQES
jgi:DNA invertase Pin-like site-specific DNA recombinase